MLPPAHLDGLERLRWYQAARAREEERIVVEDLVRRRDAGERLAPNEEKMGPDYRRENLRRAIRDAARGRKA